MIETLITAEQAAEFGGRIETVNGSRVLSCGWTPPADRDAGMVAADAAARLGFSEFRIQGRSAVGSVRRAGQYTWARRANGGRAVLYVWQQTGSCVGAGGANAVYNLMGVECARLGEPEKFTQIFWPYTYGRSRARAGMRGRGEGSSGTTWAEAARLDGFVMAGFPGTPKPENSEYQERYSGAVEMEWSDGNRAAVDLRDAAKVHVIKTQAVARSADDVRDALVNLHAVTTAGDWGGLGVCPVVDGVRLNRHADTWNHQQSIIDWWDHPSLGEIFLWLNQWPLKYHGTPLESEACDGIPVPFCTYWTKKADVEYQVRQGETIIHSAFDGFPGAPEYLPWAFV